jgi:predicted ABC-class ATPase
MLCEFVVLVAGGAALRASPLRRPVDETSHLRAIFPKQAEEFLRSKLRRFRPKKRLKAPLQVRTLPRSQAITACHNPVIPQGFEHLAKEIEPALGIVGFILQTSVCACLLILTTPFASSNAPFAGSPSTLAE